MQDPAKALGGQLGEYAQSPSSERSLSDVLRGIISNVQEMVRSEFRLVRAEVGEEIQKTGDAAKKFGIAAVAGLFGLGFVLVSLSQLLARVMPDWAATLVMGVLLVGIAAALYLQARDNLKVPKAAKSIENVKENVEWAKNQTKF